MSEWNPKGQIQAGTICWSAGGSQSGHLPDWPIRSAAQTLCFIAGAVLKWLWCGPHSACLCLQALSQTPCFLFSPPLFFTALLIYCGYSGFNVGCLIKEHRKSSAALTVNSLVTLWSFPNKQTVRKTNSSFYTARTYKYLSVCVTYIKLSYIHFTFQQFAHHFSSLYHFSALFIKGSYIFFERSLQFNNGAASIQTKGILSAWLILTKSLKRQLSSLFYLLWRGKKCQPSALLWG